MGKIGQEQEIDLLKMEYQRLAEEIRMYVKEYSPKLTVFGAFLATALAYAYGNDRFTAIYPVVPYFIFILGGVTISQSYIIACLAERIRRIEKRISILNGGPILCWERDYAMKLIYPPWLILPKEGGDRYIGSNPVVMSVALMVISAVPLVGYCIFRTWDLKILPYPLDLVYVVFTSILFIGITISAFSFFKLGNDIGKLLIEEARPEESANQAL